MGLRRSDSGTQDPYLYGSGKPLTAQKAAVPFFFSCGHFVFSRLCQPRPGAPSKLLCGRLSPCLSLSRRLLWETECLLTGDKVESMSWPVRALVWTGLALPGGRGAAAQRESARGTWLTGAFKTVIRGHSSPHRGGDAAQASGLARAGSDRCRAPPSVLPLLLA